MIATQLITLCRAHGFGSVGVSARLARPPGRALDLLHCSGHEHARFITLCHTNHSSATVNCSRWGCSGTANDKELGAQLGALDYGRCAHFATASHSQ